MKNKILDRFKRYSTQFESLIHDLEGKEDVLLNRIPADGGWSALQTLQHLVFVEENSLAYIRKKLSFNPVLEKAGAGAWFNSLLLAVSMKSPIKFKAPKAAGNERIVATAPLTDIIKAWQLSQQEWHMFLEKLPDELADKAVYKHPRAGRLNWLQMFDFFILHLQRHRRQIQRAIS